MAKLWQGVPGSKAVSLDPDIERFLSSLSVDTRLLDEDLECSAAHAHMLGEQGILSREDSLRLCDELAVMRCEYREGKLVVDPASEDIHSFIEEELVRRLGDTGKEIHAGRSRNDQVAVAFRLHCKRAFAAAQGRTLDCLDALLDLAKGNTSTLMPGYTHLQRAQAVTLAHELMAWCAGLERDYGRFADGQARADECPLGSGALAGSGLPVDREMTAASLGFARPSRNTMDAVADRDFCVEYASAAAMLMTHLSRACEDIALWASSEYGFVCIADSASTGSSIMPQKRNPDPAELLRGKCARVIGDLTSLLALQKGLPYAYNRDLQEDKSLFFDIEDTINASLCAFAALVRAIQPQPEKMLAATRGSFIEATDLAEFLVGRSVPFRSAYQAAKAIVNQCIDRDCQIRDLDGAQIAAAHPSLQDMKFDMEELADYLRPEACVARRIQTGGPAPGKTMEEIDRLRRFVAEERGKTGA
ncbi:MAG: argininosuccinate lyase [Spirochaetaceae bacterium]|nr:argininosuccinate lyase [Spirochaetaceae bacterium]